MCELFEVSRSGFYKWRKRVSQPQQRGELDQFIIECQAQVNQSYGYRRVCLWIKQNKSVEYHPLTVLHHMRKLDLLAQIRRRRPYTLYKQGGHRYENLLNRQFIQKQMNYRWVTDITYIITPQRTYYLCAIMDLCGRYIVAYRLGTEINATLVSDTVRDAFAREKGKVADGLLLHSDQGCQYTSEEYFALTQEYHFSASMSRRGCPYDRARSASPPKNQAIADNRSIEQRICIKPAKRSRQRDLSLLVRFMQRRATPITQKDVSRR